MTLLAPAKDPNRRAVGVVFAVVWDDRATDFGQLGQMQRSRKNAFLAAHQLADTLLWGKAKRWMSECWNIGLNPALPWCCQPANLDL
jgi:hypothetical protein